MAKNIIKVNHADAVTLVKRISILSEGSLYLSCGKDKEEHLFLQAEVAIKDETKQMRDAVPVSLGGKDAETIDCVVKASEFVAMANEVLSFDKEEDLVLEQVTGKLILKNKQVKLDIHLIEESVELKSVSNETVLMAQIYNADLSYLLKDICKFYDPDGNQKSELKNMEFIFSGKSLSVSGTTGYVFGYDRVNAAVKPGAMWKDAADAYKQKHPDEDAVVIAVPGVFTGFLASALATSSMEKVVMIIDDKYMHLRIDNMAMASIRLTDKCQDMSVFKQKFAEEPEQAFAVDKAVFESAVKMLDRKLSLEKAVGAGVPLHLAQKGKNLVIEVCDNKVEVPVVEGCVDDLDIYVLPKLLMDIMNPVKAGNMLIRVVPHLKAHVFVCGNGSIADGFSDGSAKTLAQCFLNNLAEQAQARFAAGKSVEEKKKEKKAEKKSGDEETA